MSIEPLSGAPAPFFIVGCGRSGTTLLRAMLNSHPALAIPLESLFIIDYLRAGHCQPATLRRLLPREYELREWPLALESAALQDCATPAAMLARLHRLYAGQHGKLVWGQKTPRLIRHGALLRRHFPGCRFIHVIRDPRAVVNSLIHSEVHRSNAYFAAQRWVRDVSCGLALARDYPTATLAVRYERLVREPEPVLREICDFLCLAFDPLMLAYQQQVGAEYGAYYRQIHAALNRPPDPGRIDHWRGKLAARDIAVVEARCGPLMDQLGYPRLADQPVPGGYQGFLKLQRQWLVLRQLTHYLRKRPGYLWSFARRKLYLRQFWTIGIHQ